MKKTAIARVPVVFQVAARDLADVIALQNVAAGIADAAQQKRALNWIIYKACGFNDISFRPGSPDETAFNEGKRFVVQQIQTLLTDDPMTFKEY